MVTYLFADCEITLPALCHLGARPLLSEAVHLGGSLPGSGKLPPLLSSIWGLKDMINASLQRGWLAWHPRDHPLQVEEDLEVAGIGGVRHPRGTIGSHADNGNAMRVATLESRLKAIGVLRSFSRSWGSNDNRYCESLFRTVKYRPDYPSRPFANKEEACMWACEFVDWYKHLPFHSGIRFVAPHQRHSGAASAI